MKRILLTGGPGTGKTTVLNRLKQRGYFCFEEVSRVIIKAAQKKGIEQLFLTHPDEFNQKILSGRINQHLEGRKIDAGICFLDRGLPDIIAYNNYIGANTSEAVLKAVQKYRYDFVFVFPPWKNIYTKDNERYESFNESVKIYENLKNTYTDLNYEVLEVPINTASDRVNYILNIAEYS